MPRRASSGRDAGHVAGGTTRAVAAAVIALIDGETVNEKTRKAELLLLCAVPRGGMQRESGRCWAAAAAGRCEGQAAEVSTGSSRRLPRNRDGTRAGYGDVMLWTNTEKHGQPDASRNACRHPGQAGLAQDTAHAALQGVPAEAVQGGQQAAARSMPEDGDTGRQRRAVGLISAPHPIGTQQLPHPASRRMRLLPADASEGGTSGRASAERPDGGLAPDTERRSRCSRGRAGGGGWGDGESVTTNSRSGGGTRVRQHRRRAVAAGAEVEMSTMRQQRCCSADASGDRCDWPGRFYEDLPVGVSCARRVPAAPAQGERRVTPTPTRAPGTHSTRAAQWWQRTPRRIHLSPRLHISSTSATAVPTLTTTVSPRTRTGTRRTFSQLPQDGDAQGRREWR